MGAAACTLPSLRHAGVMGEHLELRVCLPSELLFFLSPVNRRDEIHVRYDGSSSMGHIVESLGVPLTEVGELRLDDNTLDVRAPKRPQRTPPDTHGFVLDVHLGALARRLRLVGVDAAYDNDKDDDALVEQANTERRVLLTQDRRLLMRRALWLGAHVRGDQPDDQLRDALNRFAPRLEPWTRCLACNDRLASVAKADIAHRLPPGTRRSYNTFRRCVACGHIYWRGAHGDRLEQIVEGARRTVRQHPDGP